MVNALLALLLAGAAIAVLAYVVSLLVTAAKPSFGGVWERQRIGWHTARARRGDELLAKGQIDGALNAWRGAFYLSPLSNRTLAATVTNHHTALLSRLLAVTSDLQGGSVRLLSLAKTDRLLAERNELQRRYFSARQSGRRERTRETLALLRNNAAELQATLRQLVGEIQAARQPAPTH